VALAELLRVPPVDALQADDAGGIYAVNGAALCCSLVDGLSWISSKRLKPAGSEVVGVQA
jgi:hypothetical protein